MIGNLYSKSRSPNNSTYGLNSDFRSPFMYSLDDSTRTGFGGFMEDAEVAEQKGSTGYYTSSDDDDSTISSDGNDKFMTEDSIMIGDENLDDLEQALESFARKEEREAGMQAKAAKKAQKEAKKRRKSTGDLLDEKKKNVNQRRAGSMGTGGGQLLGSLKNSEHSRSRRSSKGASTIIKKGNETAETALTATDVTDGTNEPSLTKKKDHRRRNRDKKLKKQSSNRSVSSKRSVGSSKSLNMSDFQNKGSNHGKSPGLAGSNRSLMSLCSPKDQLRNVFLDISFLDKLDWSRYFADIRCYEAISDEMMYAVKSKNVKKLRKIWQRGGNLHAVNDQGETLVHLVCRQGCSEMLMFLMVEAKVTVRVRDATAGKTPLHEVCWRPTFDAAMAMMLMSDSPELLWVEDVRGFLSLDYVPRRALLDYYDFMEVKAQMLRLALQFSRFKASSMELNENQNRLKVLIQQQLSQ